MILLTPGPCMTSESVRQAGAMLDLNHRDPAYLELIQETKGRLLGVYGSASSLMEFRPYLIGGSGTAAMEAMATSCVSKGPVLILANGYYSERMAEIFAVHGILHEVLRFEWTQPWDMGRIEEKLRDGQFEAVVGAHHETTTGRLNPVAELGRVARPLGVRVLIDAMSSFGADDLDFEAVDVVCSSANKCLHGIPGVSFVLVSPGFEFTERRRTYYLSLPMYEGDKPPLTPPVPALAALRQALREMEPGLAPSRRERYLRQRDRVREALAALGMTPLLPAQESSSALTVAALPSGWKYEAWFQANKEAGFILYGCKGALASTHFQVSTMGEVSDDHVEAWLGVARHLIQK